MPGEEAEYTVEVGEGRDAEGDVTKGKFVSGSDDGTVECKDETGECRLEGWGWCCLGWHGVRGNESALESGRKSSVR